ncbi:MAG: hypothetical protein QXD24_03945 [Candidatus Caldarchaeum sp.]
MFRSRYDTTAGLRLRIPSHYTYLFKENGFMENNDGNGENNGQKLLFIDLWVEDGILYMLYKPDEEYENTPSFKAPNYRKGIGFCARCQKGHILEYSPKCSIHGIKLRTKPRKKKQTTILTTTYLKS